MGWAFNEAIVAATSTVTQKTETTKDAEFTTSTTSAPLPPSGLNDASNIIAICGVVVGVFGVAVAFLKKRPKVVVSVGEVQDAATTAATQSTPKNESANR